MSNASTAIIRRGADDPYRNVLKLRKQEAMARAADREAFEAQAALKVPVKPLVQTTINTAALDTKVRVARKSSALRPRISLPSEDVNNCRSHVDKEVLRRAVWKASPHITWIDICGSLVRI